MKPIKHIRGNIKNSNKDINIKLEGKNLIIAGGNGSGKTSLVTDIYKTLNIQIIQKKLLDIPQINKNHRAYSVALTYESLDQEKRLQHINSLEQTKKELASTNGPINLSYENPIKLINGLENRSAILRFYSSDRKAAINSASSATASQPDIESIDFSKPAGNNLEQHLVNLRVRHALAIELGETSETGTRSAQVKEWIESFTMNLKYLFEDPSTELIFSPDKLKYYISQTGKPHFSFQSLSSGYLAIFDIYADLIMHTEYARITPSELSGVVIIDEIDVHLHVSLQRKILPFLTASFPSIQFIVTTHSPFVLTSVDNALIFDITTCKSTLDLSMFSYESVIEGLLGVPPISKKLEDAIKELTTTTSTDPFNIHAAELLLRNITPYIDVLDAESEMFYQIAANKIIKSKVGNE